VWEHDGTPVAMSCLTRRFAGTTRVTCVYTPPGHRRHGFAGAVTATVSQAALDAGATDIVLFADLAKLVV
jgi:predicted GNAT family acetyltransferase